MRPSQDRVNASGSEGPPSVPDDRRLDANLRADRLLGLTPRDGRRYDLVALGDTGVDLMVRVQGLPERDGKAIGEHLGIYGGGMAANFAAAASKACPDLNVTLVSRVGSDPFGAQCLADLRSGGVDTSHVQVQPDGVTWWCAVALDDTGEKVLLGGRTSASLPHREDLPDSLVADARWLHVLGDVSFSAEIIELGRAAGTITSVDIEGSFAEGEPSRASWLAASADVVVINASGLITLTHESDPLAGALSLLHSGPRRGPRLIVLTLGAGGAMVVHADEGGAWRTRHHPVAPVAVVDSTGAGDSFAGTLIAHLVAGQGIGEGLTLATQAATNTLGHLGARSHGLPTYAAITGGTN